MFNIYIGNAIDPVEVLVSEATTLRQAYADAGLPLASGSMITHNAVVLGNDALDKPISTLGIAAGDYLTVSQKLKSALDIRVRKNVPGNFTLVVKSKLTGKVMKYVPDHVLYEKDEDGNKNATYVISTAKTGSGNVSNTGMTFRVGSDNDAPLTLVVPMECGEEQVRAFVAGWQRKAQACEEKIMAEYAKVTEAMAAVRFED